MIYYCPNCDVELQDEEVENDLCPYCEEEIPEADQEVG